MGEPDDTGERPDFRRTSDVLREFLDGLTEPRVRLVDVRDALGDRAFGILLFVFSVPNLIPSGLPGISTVLGIPLLLLSAQLVMGRSRPWFPRAALERSFKTADFVRVIGWALPYLARIERFLKPRLTVLVSWSGERAIGAVCFILAVLLALPIPLGNWLPSLAICLFALALVEKDGAAVIVGFVIGAASVLVVWGVLLAFVKAGLYLVSRFLA